jgi:hypothetical protein
MLPEKPEPTDASRDASSDHCTHDHLLFATKNRTPTATRTLADWAKINNRRLHVKG